MVVKKSRLAAGLTQIELAERIGVDASVISKIENEGIGISPDVYGGLVSELRGLKPADLLNAMGYRITVPGSDRLPPELVKRLLTWDPEDLDALARVVEARRARRGPQPEDPSP
jgi:transcriptional regulator with XRE-family HTH domain